MKKLVLITVLAALLAIITGSSVVGQVLNKTRFFAFYQDVPVQSTINGQPLPVGSIITAFDPDGVYCGIDTVEPGQLGTFGAMPVYGDDPETPSLDEGALAGQTISFKVNGHDATVVAGDPTWNDQTTPSVTLEVTGVTAGLLGVDLPGNRAGLPGETMRIAVGIENTGTGLDFYDVNVSLSIPEDPPFGWEKMEPDSFVYNNPGDTAYVYFDIKVATFSLDTVNTISYTVFSGVDNSQTVQGSFDIFLTITDVKDGDGNMPGGFALNQNYPNPFNPSTVISFSLPARSSVRMDIIDILGRVVSSNDLGDLPAGDHSFEFDATGQASGVYFYRLMTEYVVDTKKMILMK